jgi:hypothetical protein
VKSFGSPGLVVVTGLTLVCAQYLCAVPLLSVQSAAVSPGATVLVAVNYATDTNAPSLQFDLVYATNYLASGPPVAGNALSDHQLASAEPSPGVRRVLIFSFSNSPITNGVLAFVPFSVASNSPDHDEALLLTNVVVVNANADPVPADAAGGVLAVAIPPRFNSIVQAGGGTMRLQLSGTSGRSYVISVTTNLSFPQWSGLVTNPAPAGILEFDDASAGTLGSRFYRASLAQ